MLVISDHEIRFRPARLIILMDHGDLHFLCGHRIMVAACHPTECRTVQSDAPIM